MHLPPKSKLLDAKPLMKLMGRTLRARKGNFVSSLFRLIFEKEGVKKLLGTNLAFLVFASAFVPSHARIEPEYEKSVIESPLVLKTEKGVQNPVKSVKITQGYRFYHPGIDFDGITGENIYPIMAGKISEVGYSRFGYGNSVLIDHGNGVTSLYAHLSKIEVVGGQEVVKETKLGEMGATGRSFGDHLHLEIYENEKSINPLSVLPR